MTRITIAGLLLTLAASPLLASCTRSINGRVPDLDAAMTVIQADQPVPPSVDGLSREHWPRGRTGWHSGVVTHSPTFSQPLRIADDTARQRGEYPTVESVSDPTHHAGTLAWEGVVAVPHVGWLILKAPFEMVTGDWPWSDRESDGSGFERTPSAATSVEPPRMADDQAPG